METHSNNDVFLFTAEMPTVTQDTFDLESAVVFVPEYLALPPVALPAIAEVIVEDTHLARARKLLVYLSLPFIALSTSISPAIFTLYSIEFSLKKIALTEKMALSLTVWLVLALPSLWTHWHYTGARADGRLDAPVQNYGENTISAPGHLILAFMAGIAPFFNGVLLALAAPLLQQSLPRLIVGAILLGTLNFLAWLVIDLPAIWRKYIEGTNIQALPFKAPTIISVALREIYPPVMGVIQAQAFYQALLSALSLTSLTPKAQRIIGWLLAIAVYEGSALSARNFNIRQIKECSEAQDLGFSMQGLLAGSKNAWLAFLGQAINGQLLGVMLHKLHCSAQTSAVIIAAFNAMGVFGIARRGLLNYVSSARADQGLLCRVLLGEQHALAIARITVPCLESIAVLLATTKSFTEIATIRAQLSEDHPLVRVAPANTLNPG